MYTLKNNVTEMPTEMDGPMDDTENIEKLNN